MKAVGMKDRMYFSNQCLTPALNAGFIKMTVPDKPRSSQQRYRLTAKGQSWLDWSEGEFSNKKPRVVPHDGIELQVDEKGHS